MPATAGVAAAFDGGVFDEPVYAPDLAVPQGNSLPDCFLILVTPRMVRLGQAVFGAAFLSAHVDHVTEVAGRRSFAAAGLVAELHAIAGTSPPARLKAEGRACQAGSSPRCVCRPGHLFVAIDHISKFAFARLEQKANRVTATACLEALIEVTPYKIHTASRFAGPSAPRSGMEGPDLRRDSYLGENDIMRSLSKRALRAFPGQIYAAPARTPSRPPIGYRRIGWSRGVRAGST